MSKKECELCQRAAVMFCDSDQASLCWDCDEKVHAANFLVAKHSRTLLCHDCRSPTPWKAVGLKLTRMLSVCRTCADRNVDSSNSQSSDDEDDDSIEEDDESIEEDEEDEDEENQVVPLSTAVSSSEDDVSCSSSKRHRDTLRSESEEDEEESSISSGSKRMRIGFPNGYRL